MEMHNPFPTDSSSLDYDILKWQAIMDNPNSRIFIFDPDAHLSPQLPLHLYHLHLSSSLTSKMYPHTHSEEYVGDEQEISNFAVKCLLFAHNSHQINWNAINTMIVSNRRCI